MLLKLISLILCLRLFQIQNYNHKVFILKLLLYQLIQRLLVI